jgi:hypothetical protein
MTHIWEDNLKLSKNSTGERDKNEKGIKKEDMREQVMVI